MRVAHDAVQGRPQPANESARVEAVLLAHPSVADCVVLERTSDQGIVESIAYVVPSSALPVQELRDLLAAASISVPAQFVSVSSIPLTADGAVDVAALSELPVHDDALLAEWEARATVVLGGGLAAAIVGQATPRVLPLHLAPLLPDESGREPATNRRADGHSLNRRKAKSDSEVRAIVDGGSVSPLALTSLADALERAAVTSRHGLVYVAADGSTVEQSYADLLDRATRILGGLQACGLGHGDRVIFQIERQQDFIETFWACVLGGFVPVPAAVPTGYERSSPQLHTLQTAWATLDTPHVVASRQAVADVAAAAERLPLRGARVHAVEDLRASAPGRKRASGADDPALLMLTSGSTGTPKAVMLTHRNILSRTAGSRHLNGFSDRDVTLNWMPLDHVAGLIYFHIRDVVLGCRQIQVPTSRVLQDPLTWIEALDRYRATITFAPNFAFALVNDREREIGERSWDLSSVRFVLNGAEAIVPRTARRFLTLLGPHGLDPTCMTPAWGMSETSSGVIYGDRFSLANTSDEDAFVEVGQPIPGLSMRIVDGDDRVVNAGVVGRLQVSGVVVTTGYFGNASTTREAFTDDGWFKTGDLGFIRDDRLTITGREKDVVIVNSVNYYCHEIESVVEALDGVATTLVAACPVRPDDANTDRLAIFFHPVESQGLEELLARIRSEVSATIGIVPDYLLPVDAAAIPKTSLGKIQRAELARRFALGEFDAIRERIDRLTSNANTIPDWFFRKVWRRKQGRRDGAALVDGACALLLVNRDPLASALQAALRARGIRTVAVRTGESFSAKHADGYTIDPREERDYARLVDAVVGGGATPSLVLHLWGYGKYAGEATGEAIDEAQWVGALSLVSLVKALAAATQTPDETSLLVVASHTQSVVFGDRVACEKAPAIGIVKTLPQELPWLRCRHVDLPAKDPAGSASLIVDELAIRQDDREVAYRGGERFVARLEKVAFDHVARKPPLFTRAGTYLITGGGGGMAERIAGLLLERYDANLLLVGRRELDSARLDTIERLRRRGGRLVYEVADVIDEARLEAIVAKHTAQWGRLDGVIHLAGTYDERLLVDERPDHLLAMLRAKTRGTDALHRLLARRGGGFLIASSSVAGFFGGASIGAYSAANCFQQAFADCHCDRGLVQHFCFSWSNWSDVGQSRGYQLTESPRARGYRAMPPDQALHSLLVGLAFREPALLVGLDAANRQIRRHLVDDTGLLEAPILYYTASDASAEAVLSGVAVRDRFGRRSRADVVRVVEMPTTPAGEVDRDELVRRWRARDEGAFAPPRTEAERRVADIWRRLLGVSTVGRADSFFDLGGDSLAAARLVAEMRQAFGVDVSLRTVFDARTLAELAEAIETAAPLATDTPKKATAELAETAEKDLALRATAETAEAAEKNLALRSQRSPRLALASSLTPGERALWVLHQIAPDSSAYNIAFTARVVSPLNVAALQRAFQALVDRHDALRTVFPSVHGESSRRVHAVMTVPFDIVDASDWPLDSVHEQIARETKRPFDLAAGPLVRVRLFTQPSQSFLTATFHHIVMDGWSLWVCLSELGDLYRAALTGTMPSGRPASTAAATFARRQAEMATSADGARHLEFWKSHVGDVPVLNLPTDRPRPVVARYRGASETFHIARETAGRLGQIAREARATPQMALLTLFGVLLQRYTGQERLSIGYLTSGRSSPELESMVGYFANPLPLAPTLPQHSTFGDALKRTRDTLLEALDHEEYPFSLLVDRLGGNRDASRSPLFQVLFVYEKPQRLESENAAAFIAGVPGALMHLGDLTFESLPFQVQQEGQFDVTLMAVEVDGGIRFTLDYNTDLFDRATVRRMGDHLVTLAGSACAEPDRSIATLPMLTAGERRQLAAWNDVRAEHGSGCVHRMFEDQAARHPAATALVFGPSRLTYAELNARANRLARYLRDGGLTTGTPVGLLFDRSSIDLVVSMVGVLKAGGAFLPLDRAHPAERLMFMCADAGATILLTESALAGLLPAYQGRVIVVDRDAGRIERVATTNLPDVGTPDDLAYIIYTSGSTGRPKGVLLEHRGLWNVAREQQRVFLHGPGARVLQFASLSFDACVYETVMALSSGASLHLASRESLLPGLPLLQTLKAQGITNLTIPPSALANLAADALPALDTLMVAGEACPPELIARWAAPGRRFFNLYGPTEATIWATYAECTDGTRLPPIGIPLANTQAFVLDANLQELPVGVPGELYLGGAGLARGYVNQPELAAERFIRDPFSRDPDARLYRTGDIVRRAEDGQLFYLGRADSQVKLRGFRVELGEIEAALGRHPDVVQAVVAVHGDDGNRRLVGYFVASRPVAVSTLKRFLRAELPDYMVPAAFVAMDRFPQNASGKVDRAALPIPDAGRQVEEAFAPPTGELQQRVAGIWQQVLRIDRVGADDNFFDLGGNSLLVAQVHARLNEIEPIDLSVVDMFRFPTVRELAQHLDGASHAEIDEPVAAGRGEALLAGRARLRDQSRRRGAATERTDGSR